MMAEDRPGPVAIEFRRVINETELGSPLIESLDRLAARMDLRDLDWMVQAIRIQQSVGGPLAELLATLADFMRGREELRREVAVLTAEGRASAWVLGAMPALLLAAVAVVNPGYLDPMLRGWGPWFLGVSTLSVVTGIWFILRMVRSVEV
jgi:tight adherence protein B